MDGRPGSATRSGYVLRALGTPEVLDRNGSPVRKLMAQPKRLLLLTYLVHSGRAVTRAILVRLFWPDSEERRARNALRQALYFLGCELEHSVVQSLGTKIVSVPPGTVDYDAHTLTDPQRQASADVLDLYRGPFLHGVDIRGSNDLQTWVDGERARIERRARDTAVTLAEAAAREGRLVDASRLAGRAARIAPLDEPTRILHIQLLDRCGHRADALHEAESFRRHVAAAFDLPPSPEFERFVSALHARGDSDSQGARGVTSP